MTLQYGTYFINPRPGGGLNHLRHGGGGGQNDPDLTRKLGKLEGRAIRLSKALSESDRSHFGQFLAQVNIEVSRGQQRSHFRKIMVVIRNAGHYPGNYNSHAESKKQKKTKDSS